MIIVTEPVGSDLRNVVLRLGGFHTERSSVAPIMYRFPSLRYNRYTRGTHCACACNLFGFNPVNIYRRQRLIRHAY